jgi:two-component system OmpR family response regulator
MESPSIVLVEGDAAYRRQLSAYLQANDLKLIEFDNFDTLNDQIDQHDRSVFLANLGSDPAQSLDFLKFVGARHRCPILVLSDTDDQTDRIVCLEQGADDYIVKTTPVREILARVRAAARRLASAPPANPPRPPEVSEQPIGTWRFSPAQRELVAPAGELVALTTAEFNLLDVLARNVGTPLNRDYLSRAVFGRVFSATDRSIDNLIARLRRKLGDPARAPRMIKTARPVGYVFTGFADPQA